MLEVAGIEARQLKHEQSTCLRNGSFADSVRLRKQSPDAARLDI
jgi:hypothetical protein